MLNNLLKVSTELQAQGYPKFPSVGETSLYALLGFVIAFIGIAFLIFIVWAMGKLMAFADNKSSEQPKKEKKSEPKKSVETSPSTTAEAEIDEETVAAITAALMAYYVKENRKCEFTVKRIKRL